MDTGHRPTPTISGHEPSGDPRHDPEAEGPVESVSVHSLKPRDRVVLQTESGPCHLTVGKNRHCVLCVIGQPDQTRHVLLRGGADADATGFQQEIVYVGGRLVYAIESEPNEPLTTSVIESITFHPGPW